MMRFFFGILGFSSAVFSVLLLFAPGSLLQAVSGISSPLISLIVSGSGLFLTLWTLSSRGCKHTAFWFTLIIGVVLVIFSVTSVAPDRLSLFHDESLAVTGLMIIIGSRIVALRLTMNTRRYYSVFGLFTAAAVLGLGALVPAGMNTEELSFSQGKAALLAVLHPEARDYIDDIDGYVNDLIEDDSLDPAEKEAEIQILNRRIIEMEAELSLFEEMREENRDNRREIAMLRQRVEEALAREGSGDGEGFSPVMSFAQAVQPDLPVVRDFAAALAAESPGSFYRSRSFGDPSPGTIGMKQIITIHRYISGEWKYVNDPMFVDRDYYSPAGRTISTGLAGDCDDYAILTASAIEAIGGKTRIMSGSCSEGGHAWPEVYIGERSAWNEAMRVVDAEYPGRKIQYIRDDSGEYWLCLDWQLGIYSCGGSPEVRYQSEWR